MSNRLIEIGRIPLIPDPIIAMRAGAMLEEGIARTNQAIQYSADFFEPPRLLIGALRRYGQALDRATYMRDISVMDDRELESRGIQREEIRELFFRENVDDYLDHPTNNRAGDKGR